MRPWALGHTASSLSKPRKKMEEKKMLEKALRKAIAGEDLDESEAFEAVAQILAGGASPIKTGAFLTALRMKGICTEELLGATRALKKLFNPWSELRDGFLAMDREEINVDEETVERTSLPGKKGTATFNVSTACALVVAACGVKVVRHGNLVPSDYVGTEHVLRALGVEPEITPAVAKRCLEEANVAFVYSPMAHPSARLLYQVRRQLGFRTLFNLAGPLVNPCGANAVYLGVYDPRDLLIFATVLRSLGTEKGIVVHGEGTLDEASVTGLTRICILKPGGFEIQEFHPEDLNLRRASPPHIKGGNARENASIIRSILEGESGPRRDLVVLNAALALVASGAESSIGEGMSRASEAIDSGVALRVLNTLVELTNEAPCLRKVDL